jgi:hypothetical protein
MGLTITAHRKFAGGVSYHSRRRISCAASQREAEHGVSWLEAVRWAPPSPLHLRCTSEAFPTHPTGRCMTVRIKSPKFQQITNKRNQQASRCDHDGSDATCARSRDDVPGSLRYSGVDLSWGVVIAKGSRRNSRSRSATHRCNEQNPGGCPGLCMSTRARSAFATRSCAQTRSRFLCVVAFSAENRKSTFPENAPVL